MSEKVEAAYAELAKDLVEGFEKKAPGLMAEGLGVLDGGLRDGFWCPVFEDTLSFVRARGMTVYGFLDDHPQSHTLAYSAEVPGHFSDEERTAVMRLFSERHPKVQKGAAQ